jgi:nitrite reductase/ring-hydroxylating ferredoxin subunit
MAHQSSTDGAGDFTNTSETGDDWKVLEGFDPETASYPARARLGEERIVIFLTAKGYRGTSRKCPHMFATMLAAELAGNETMVRCPLHVFTFRLSDGKGVNCPGFRIDVYDIRHDGGHLYGRLTPRPPSHAPG